MSETLFELISGINSSEGYLTDAWLDRLRAFKFSPQEAAQFLAWLPNIKPQLACCTINRSHGETDLGSPADLIEFHTGGWSGAEGLIAAMLEHFWIRYFHTKWSRGGHFSFVIPAHFLHAPCPPVSPLSLAPQIAPLNDIIGYLLFSVSRSGSWQAWRLIDPDERQRFLEWAEQEVIHLGTLGWHFLSRITNRFKNTQSRDRYDNHAPPSAAPSTHRDPYSITTLNTHENNMPLFKLRATDEVLTTYEFYVEAANAKEAAPYAAGLDSLDSTPGVLVESVETAGGAIDSVQLVEATPEGAFPIKAQWNGGLAILPTR